MKFRSLMAGLLLAAVLTTPAFAQEIRITVPDGLQIDQEAAVTIQILDNDGNPIGDADPDITFSPAASVEEISFFNCFDIGDKDNCQANNRDVEGHYESLLKLLKSPVTMTVASDGATAQASLSAGASAAPVATTTPAPVASQPTEATGPATPGNIKVGPSPSFWLIALPFLLMTLVVTYFVVKTD